MRYSDSSNRRSFLIWGAGGHGRMVGDLVRAVGQDIAGYVDRDGQKLGTKVELVGSSISYVQSDLLATLHSTGEYPEGIDASALGIGDNRMREACLRDLDGLEAPPLVHPSATVNGSVMIGRGSVVFPNAVINAGTRIGDAVIVNSGAIIEHDCTVQDAVHVSPGGILCGGVSLGKRTWIGAGATVIQGVRIGSDVVVGAGSTVLADVPDRFTVVGTPARPVSSSNDREGVRPE